MAATYQAGIQGICGDLEWVSKKKWRERRALLRPLLEEYKNKNNVPFCFIKGWEYLKDLPDFGYEVQVAGLPEGQQDDGEKDSAVASTARMMTPRPMGAKAAKRAQVQAQNSQKKSKAMAEGVKGMGSKVEDVAKAMREKSVLDCYHCMLELYSRAGNQEKVEDTIAKTATNSERRITTPFMPTSDCTMQSRGKY